MSRISQRKENNLLCVIQPIAPLAFIQSNGNFHLCKVKYRRLKSLTVGTLANWNLRFIVAGAIIVLNVCQEREKKRVSTSHTAHSLIHNLMIASSWEAKLMERKCKWTGRCRHGIGFMNEDRKILVATKWDRWQLFHLFKLNSILFMNEVELIIERPQNWLVFLNCLKHFRNAHIDTFQRWAIN